MIKENEDQKLSASAVPESLQNKKFRLPFGNLSRKKTLLSLGICAIPVGIGAYLIQVPVGCGCGNPAIGKAGMFTRYQEWYFTENQKFTSSTEELPGLMTPTRRHRYSIEVAQDRAFFYATPNVVFNDFFRLGLSRASIDGVVSAIVYDAKQKRLVRETCISNIPNSGRPPRPIFKAGQIICPDNFSARSSGQ
ncbi:MAG: type IV pilin-like G/H family protein [Pseudanabaenaceae cyanobacterium]|jgi:hypothetical protein